MTALSRLFVRERSPGKLAAVYRNGSAAEEAARRLRTMSDLSTRQVQVVEPGDPAWERKVEPEGIGIWRTAVQAHVTCGVLGFAAGTLAFVALYAAGVQAIVTTPVAGFLAFTLLSTAFGLLAGGLITMRPDHELVIDPVREAAREGRWAIVVHPVSTEQRRVAAFVLRASGARVSETL